jgi:hypothetical protein
MQLTPAASEIVRKALAATSLPRPVIHLVQVGPGPAVTPAVARAVHSNAPPAEVVALFPQGEIERALRSPRRLVAAVYPRRQYLRPFLTKVEGIYFFCMGMRRTMSSATLDVQDGELVLKNRAGVIVLPQQPQAVST